MSARPVDPKLPLGGDPRVQLLPQSVRDRAKAVAVRRRLAMLIVLALVVVGGGYGYAWMRNVTAQQQLATARQQTQAVLEEQAEYAEGSRAASLVTSIRSAQTRVTENEVLWQGVLSQLVAFLPEGTTVRTISAVAQASWEPPLTVEGPLRQSRLALVTLTLLSPTVLDPASVVPLLSGIEGYVDARFDSSVLEPGVGQYTTVIRVMVDSEASSGRFVDAVSEGDDE